MSDADALVNSINAGREVVAGRIERAHAGNPSLIVAIRGFVLSIVLDKRHSDPGRWARLTDAALAEALAKMPLLGSDLKDLQPSFSDWMR